MSRKLGTGFPTRTCANVRNLDAHARASQWGHAMAETFLRKIAAELEAPRRQRPFGSGWIAGTLGLLCGLTGLAMVVMLRYPSLTQVPQLAAIHESVLFKAFLYFVLIWGFLLAAL